MRVRKPPPLEDSDLVIRAFGPDEMILAASPELIAVHGKPQTLEDIGRNADKLSMASARRELDLAFPRHRRRAR